MDVAVLIRQLGNSAPVVTATTILPREYESTYAEKYFKEELEKKRLEFLANFPEFKHALWTIQWLVINESYGNLLESIIVQQYTGD